MKEKLKNKNRTPIIQKNKNIISSYESFNFKEEDELKLVRKNTQFHIS